MKKKIFIILGYQNFTNYFIELTKYLKKTYEVTCLVYGYNNYLKVKENKELFHEIYSYEELVNKFYNEKKYDYENLVYFENKFGQLWKLLYADRQLLDYFYDVDYGNKKLNYDDLLSFLNHWIFFFNKIFSSKEFKYIISYSTASFPAILSVKIAKFYETKYLCFKTLGIPDRYTIIDDLNEKFLVPEAASLDNEWSKNYLNNFKENNKPDWIKKRKKISLFIRILKLIKNNINEKKVFDFIDNNKTAYLNHTLLKIIKLKIKKIYRNIYFHYLQKKFKTQVNSKYIFFPLHVEPESNLMVKNVLNSDQISLLENLSKLCPIDTKIVIKDHPNQPIRSPNFYKRIIKIPNVIFLESSTNSRKLIKDSHAVFCISGTSILETLLLRKKLLVFGNNIIIENFFPNLKCNFQNFNKKLCEHTLPQEIEIVNMLTYLKNISIDVGSEILIKKGNIEEIGKSFFNLFERIDNEDN